MVLNKKQAKSVAVKYLVDILGIEEEAAEKVVEFLIDQGKRPNSFPLHRIEDYLWRKADIHDALSIENITNEHSVNKTNTFLYTVSKHGKHIFNNLSHLKEVIGAVDLDSNQRCRLSFEVRGQPRTGKTLCSRYVLPYFCAKKINKMRKKKELSKLLRFPVLYILSNKDDDVLFKLYNELETKFHDLVSYQNYTSFNGKQDYTIGIGLYLQRFANIYPQSHMFIVLDEIQLIKPKYLDDLRTITKSQDYPKCTFILTGSTVSRFNQTLRDTYRNGLSYFDNVLTYDIPFSNKMEDINEALKIMHGWKYVNRNTITKAECLKLKEYCTSLNVAYVCQSLKYEISFQDFKKSLKQLICEIFSIYERDIKVDNHVVQAVLTGNLKSLSDTYLVTKVNNRLQLTDKLFSIFLNANYTISDQGKVQLKSKDSKIHCSTMIHVRIFGERILRYLKWKQNHNSRETPKAFSGIDNFLSNNQMCTRLTKDNIVALYDKLKTISNTHPDMPDLKKSSKIDMLKQFFSQMRHTICHQQSVASDVENKFTKLLKKEWLRSEEDFSNFIISLMEVNELQSED